MSDTSRSSFATATADAPAITAAPALSARAAALAARYRLPLHASASQAPPDWLLRLDDSGLALVPADSALGSPIRVDFSSGASDYRRRHGGGRRQLIAKAIGFKHGPPRVVDATAGLGRDAFVLAGLGCTVLMLERSAAIAALLEDGLRRAARVPGLDWLPTRLTLRWIDARRWLHTCGPAEQPDVVYLDPMYPQQAAKPSTALVKKESRALRAVVGDDADAAELLAAAQQCARRRVVVKRHLRAPTIAGSAPALVYKEGATRYDVYFRPTPPS